MTLEDSQSRPIVFILLFDGLWKHQLFEKLAFPMHTYLVYLLQNNPNFQLLFIT